MRQLILCALLLAPAAPSFAAQGQPTEPPGKLDALHYEIEAEIVPERATLRGRAKVRFLVLEDALTLPFQLSNRLVLTNVSDENERYSTRYTDFGTDRMLVRGVDPFVGGREYTLTFDFEGTLETEQYAFLETPERAPAFISRDQALLQSQGHWFPAHDLPIDTATFTLRVKVPLGFTVVGPGEMQPIEMEGVKEVFTWASKRPLGEVPVVVARFLRERFPDEKTPLTFFVGEDFDRDLTAMVEEAGKILEFYRGAYGPVDLTRLNLAQVGNVLLAGKGSLGLVLLEKELLRGGDVPVKELADRLALQWWGYSMHFRTPSDAWLRDGFARYSALRYLEGVDQELFETELAKTAVDALKYEDRAPVAEGLALEPGRPQYDSVVASKGAWVLYMLSQIVGRDRFHAMLGDWYREKRGASASTGEFQAFVEKRAGADFTWFFTQWLEQVGVPEFKVDYTIYKRRDGSYRIEGQVKQDLDLFRMPVDLLIETKGKPEEKQLEVKGRRTSFDFTTQTLPERIKFDPHGKILIDSEQMRLRVHVALGDEFLDQGEFVAAIAEYEKAKAEDPRSSLVHYRLGEVYFRQQSYNLAANAFRDALNGDLQPEWVETWTHIHLGKIFDVLGQRQRALAEYQKAVNSGIDYRGAQAEAQKYIKEPYSKPSNFIN